VREGGRERLLPVRVPGAAREVAGQELAYIVRSLLDLRLQVEDLRRRLEERPQRVEVIAVGRAEEPEAELVEAGPGRGTGAGAGTPEPGREGEKEAGWERDGGRDRGREAAAVVFRPGMRMAEVERATIEAALRETRGNRRKAAGMLGIGERTLYRKLKEYGLG
jgi:DNA-binding NtrC family response regulator